MEPCILWTPDRWISECPTPHEGQNVSRMSIPFWTRRIPRPPDPPCNTLWCYQLSIGIEYRLWVNRSLMRSWLLNYLCVQLSPGARVSSAMAARLGGSPPPTSCVLLVLHPMLVLMAAKGDRWWLEGIITWKWKTSMMGDIPKDFGGSSRVHADPDVARVIDHGWASRLGSGSTEPASICGLTKTYTI